MEKLFIRILNRTLLVGCVLLLTGAVLMAITAGTNYIEGSDPPADHSDIIVTYTLLPPLPTAATATADSSTDQVPPEDLALMNQATAGCEAIGHIAKAISANKLEFHGAGLTTCEKDQVGTAKKFGARAQNYLSASSSYFSAMTSDPHVATNYQNLSDDQTKIVIDNLTEDFASKFQAEIDAQNTKNASAQVNAAAHRVMSMTYISIAGSAFLAFLFIAFLIVFLRIEKHLEFMTVRKDASLS
jgi:hypothetical protein